MKNYVRSYILSGILLTAAFLVFFLDFGITPAIAKNRKEESWVLFVGGMILGLVGWREQNKASGKKEK